MPRHKRATCGQRCNSSSRLGEPGHEAVAWHQLGMVAEEQQKWTEAERCYRESLAIKERLGNAIGAAKTCNQLAIVAWRL